MTTQDDVNQKLDDAKDVGAAAVKIDTSDPVGKDVVFRLRQQEQALNEEAAVLEDKVEKEEEEAEVTADES